MDEWRKHLNEFPKEWINGYDKKFVDKLQSVFDEGNYDPANEPDIAYPYLFSRFRISTPSK